MCNSSRELLKRARSRSRVSRFNWIWIAAWRERSAQQRAGWGPATWRRGSPTTQQNKTKHNYEGLHREERPQRRMANGVHYACSTVLFKMPATTSQTLSSLDRELLIWQPRIRGGWNGSEESKRGKQKWHKTINVFQIGLGLKLHSRT